MTKRSGSAAVTTYIAAAEPPARVMLKQLRSAIKATAPTATEKISYGIPFYEYKYPGYKGRLVYFAGFKDHVSIFAWGREVDKHKELKKYKTSKGTLQFPIGKKIPIGVIKTVVRARMKQLDQGAKKRISIRRARPT